jgi:hypothetical protein
LRVKAVQLLDRLLDQILSHLGEGGGWGG